MVKSISRNGLIGLVIASAITLSACMPGLLTGRVNSATYQAIPSGESFSIIRPDSSSLTERQIQDLIKQELELLGFIFTENKNNAALLVSYSYTIGVGKADVSSNYNTSTGRTNVSSSTEYPRYFQITIIDNAASQKEGQSVLLWQSEIYSSGSMSNISKLSEYFVPELFKKFGQTVKNEHITVIAR